MEPITVYWAAALAYAKAHYIALAVVSAFGGGAGTHYYERKEFIATEQRYQQRQAAIEQRVQGAEERSTSAEQRATSAEQAALALRKEFGNVSSAMKLDQTRRINQLQEKTREYDQLNGSFLEICQERDVALHKYNAMHEERDIACKERNAERKEKQCHARLSDRFSAQLQKAQAQNIKLELQEKWGSFSIKLDHLTLLVLRHIMERMPDITSDVSVLQEHPDVEKELWNIITRARQANSIEVLSGLLTECRALQPLPLEEDVVFIRRFTEIKQAETDSLRERRLKYVQYQALAAQQQEVAAA